MRLIDADKLKEYLQNRLKEAEEKFAYEKSKEIARHTTKLLCDDADAQETVEAIPVDWIEAKTKSLASPGCKDVIDWLLAEWREEQKGN